MPGWLCENATLSLLLLWPHSHQTGSVHAALWILRMCSSFEDDMPDLRRWWCVVLVENLHLEGHGRRFAHFTKEGREMVNGLLSPIFRLERKKEPNEPNNDEKDNSELLEEAVKEAQQERRLQCADLIKCMKGSTSIREHLEAVITGGLVSAWESRKEMPTLYFEDEQLDEVVSFLFGIIGETPRARQQVDWVDFVMNVLLPEVTVHTLAEKFDMTLEEAEVKYKRGPQYEPCELKMMGKTLGMHLSEEAEGKLKVFKEKMERALSSEAFLSRL